MAHFTGSADPVDIYNPSVGLLLSKAIDTAVDRFYVGFWNESHVSLLTLHTLQC